MNARVVAAGLAGLASLLSCGGGDSGGTGPSPTPRPASVTVVTGGGQTGTVGALLPVPPAVLVRDQDGDPLPNITVSFAVTSGRGVLTGPSQVTNTEGIATATAWRLGPTPGAQQVTATVQGLSPVAFDAHANPGPPASLAIVSGSSHTVTVGTAVPGQLSIRIRDTFQNPLAGITVTFRITAGTGSLSVETAVSDSTGLATGGTWTVGTTSGPNAVTATVGALSATFLATGIAGSPVAVAAAAGDGERVPLNQPSRVNPAVRVIDEHGNGVPGVTVGLSVLQGGGTIVPASLVTGSTGLATATEWRMGPSPGPNVLRASVDSLHVDLIATGIQTGLIKLAGDSQTALAGERLPIDLTVQLIDANGNNVAGAALQVSGGVGLGQVIGGIPLTDQQGISRIGYAFGRVGYNEARIAIGQLEAVFTGTALLGPPATLSPVGGGQQVEVAMPVPGAVGARVRDLGGNPVPGVPVSFSANPGAGVITGTTAVSDTGGVALVGSWTVGTETGTATITATSPGIPSTTINANVRAGPPSSLAKLSGDGQSASAGQQLSLPIKVVVRDSFGNLAPGVTVRATVTAGGGTLPATASTNSAGEATFNGWRMGLAAGLNQVRLTVAGVADTVFFQATALQAADSLAIASGNGQSVSVGSRLPADPTVVVLDTEGLPMAGVVVQFAVQAGGGTVTQAADTSDANGLASVGWTVGTVPGGQSLIVTSGVLNTVTFQAGALTGPPTIMAAHAGNGQSLLVNETVRVNPAVLVTDSYGNPVRDLAVTFAVTAGGGTITGANRLTGANGVATLGSWTMGAAPGQNEITASIPDAGVTGNPAIFTATALVSAYDIDVRALSFLTPSQQAAFDAAASRLRGLVVGDVPDVAVNIAANVCLAGQPAVNETVDDVVIFAQVIAIDGPGGILGQAGPCVLRSGTLLPAVGVMQFDVADLGNLENAGQLQSVILHEMQHVMGFGTIWQARNILFNPGGQDPFLPNFATVDAFNSIGGTSYPGPKVPVENTGGAGTRDSHWRETVLKNELMTGFLNGGPNPLSAVTVFSFGALGYEINPGAGEPFTVGPFPVSAAGPRIQFALVDDIWRGPRYVLDRSGQLLPVPAQ